MLQFLLNLVEVPTTNAVADGSPAFDDVNDCSKDDATTNNSDQTLSRDTNGSSHDCKQMSTAEQHTAVSTFEEDDFEDSQASNFSDRSLVPGTNSTNKHIGGLSGKEAHDQITTPDGVTPLPTCNLNSDFAAVGEMDRHVDEVYSTTMISEWSEHTTSPVVTPERKSMPTVFSQRCSVTAETIAAGELNLSQQQNCWSGSDKKVFDSTASKFFSTESTVVVSGSHVTSKAAPVGVWDRLPTGNNTLSSSCFKFDTTVCEQRENVCSGAQVVSGRENPISPDECQTPDQKSFAISFQSPCKTEHDGGQNDTLVQEDADFGGDNMQDCERSFSTSSPLAKDIVNWNTLIGVGNTPPDESDAQQLREYVTGPAKQRRHEYHHQQRSSSGEMSAADSNDQRSCSVSSGSADSNHREGQNVSPLGRSSSEEPGVVQSSRRLFSSSAWNALLLRLGLDCVRKFNRSLARRQQQNFDPECSNDYCSRSNDSSVTSKYEDVEGPPCVEKRRKTSGGNVDDDENLTVGEEAERRRRLTSTCFYCLQRFTDSQALQTHFERAHSGQEPSIAVMGDDCSGSSFHFSPSSMKPAPDQQHRDSDVNGSGVSAGESSSHVTSASAAAGAVCDRLIPSGGGALSSSYFGGISPEVLSLLSSVPPELLLAPHVYPPGGGIIPPAVMVMMLAAAAASPFIGAGCPLPPPSSSLVDPHAGLLAASESCQAGMYEDEDAVAMSSAQQQSKRARTRISDSQLAILRARFAASAILSLHNRYTISPRGFVSIDAFNNVRCTFCHF